MSTLRRQEFMQEAGKKAMGIPLATAWVGSVLANEGAPKTRVRGLLNVAETCIAAGRHVQVDKPAGTSPSQYRRLMEAAARSSRTSPARAISRCRRRFSEHPGCRSSRNGG